MIERYRPQSSTLNIVAAMNHAGMFKPWFEGSSWDGWRTVLKGAFALPMSNAEREFFRTVAERDPPIGPVRELWCVVGRGGGKDSIASVIAAHAAALFKPTKLRPGERALVACLACDRDQAKIVLDYTRTFFQDILPLRGMVRRETATGFQLSNKVDIAVATNSFRSVRGRSVLCCIMDEVAFYRDERSANPDQELYNAVMPGLARVPNSILIGISTPHRKAGLLYNKFARHYGKDSDVLVIRAPSSVMNPTLDQSVIDAALEEDPALAGAEYLAEFRDDVTGWLTRELIEAAVDSGVTVRPPRPNIRYVSFCDPSGGQGDSFTCGIAHKENDAAFLDCVIEIRPPFNSIQATEQIAATLKSYNCFKTVGDKYGANWVVDAFRKCGISYQHSERDRSQIYLDTLPLFTAGRVKLLDNKRLVHQFASLERTAGSLGRDKVDHGRGGHDDLCNAAAGALIRVMTAKAPMVISDQVLALAGMRSGTNLPDAAPTNRLPGRSSYFPDPQMLRNAGYTETEIAERCGGRA
jgi:hypothetical protein